MSDQSETPSENKTIIVNKIDNSADDESQSGGSQDNGSQDSSSSPISAESKAKLDLMDATEFGLAPNPDQSGGSSSVNKSNDESSDSNQSGGSKANNSSENNGGDDGDDDDDKEDEPDTTTVVVDNDGEPTLGSSNNVKHTKPTHTKKNKNSLGNNASRNNSNRTHTKRKNRNNDTHNNKSSIIDVALPMGGKAVIPFSMPKSLNVAELRKRFEKEYKDIGNMKPEARRRRIAELEAIVFEDPSANDLAKGLLNIVDDRALKCMAMKSLLVKGL